MTNNLKEILIALSLIILAVLLLNPFHFWMPDMMVVTILICALILFALFASFVWKEKITDEREAMHRTLAGRNAFLAGSAVLMLGIIVEGYLHLVDPYLVIALIVMIIVKIGSRLWSDKNL